MLVLGLKMKNKFVDWYRFCKNNYKKYISVNLGVLDWFKSRTFTRSSYNRVLSDSFNWTRKGFKSETFSRSKSQMYFRTCSRIKNEE